MLNVKASLPMGCNFLGKGIKGHPEMGVVIDCVKVWFDTWDVMQQAWTGKDICSRIMYRTDNGYCFDNTLLDDGTYEIEDYATNWRARKRDPWGFWYI